MGVSKDTSLLFSLRQLQDLEEQRVEKERREAERRAEEKRQAELEAQRRAEEERKRREREEAERRAHIEERERLERARLEAWREAQIEKARAEAQTRAQAALAAKQREHELKLSELRETGAPKRYRRLALLGLLAALGVAAGWLALYFGHIAPEADRRAAEYRSLVAGHADNTRRARKLLEAREAQLDKLRQRVERLRKQRAGQKVEPQAPSSKDTSHTAPPHQGAPSGGAKSRVNPVPHSSPPPAESDCDSNSYDPLNECLGGG